MFDKDELFDLISSKVYLSITDLEKIAGCMGISVKRTSREKLFNRLYGYAKYRKLIECLIKRSEELKNYAFSAEERERIQDFINLLKEDLETEVNEIRTESDLIEKFLRSKNVEWYECETFVGLNSLSKIYGFNLKEISKPKAGFLAGILPDTKVFRADLICKMDGEVWVLEAKKELKDFEALGQVLVYSELYSKDTGLNVKKGIIIGRVEESMLRVFEEVCSKYNVKVFLDGRDF